MAVETVIQIRRGLAATWTTQNPTLAAGELGLETDTRKMKMGNGSTAWASLPYLVKQVDNLLLDSNTISSTNEDGNITLAPNGNGNVVVSSADLVVSGDIYSQTSKKLATEEYVDAAKQGLDVKNSVKVATTANITLENAQTIDGVSVVSGDRVLVKNQTVGSQNGIYVVVADGSWTRAIDANSNDDVTAGMFTFVEEGTVNADSGWVLNTNGPITLGTTSLSFAQFNGAGQITAGAGMTKTGNTLDVGGTADRITVSGDSVDIASTYVGQSSITTVGTIGTGTWQGTAVGVAYGGTGANDAPTARTNLGLAIGTDVQAYNSTLAAVAGGTYTGDDSITTVGTIGAGVWQGTAVGVAYGGTGATDASGARTNLGLAIGTDVQAYDAELAALAGLTSAADALPYFTGSGTASTTTLTSFGRSLVDDADASAARTTLGVIIGTDVQAYNSTLAAVAGGTYTGDDSITTVGTIGAGVWQGTAVGVAYGGTGATDASGARTNLGLAIGTDVQAYNSTLAAVAGGTYTGDDSITTVGTIGTGTWQGTAVGVAYGGTGATDASGARTNLGLAIGTDVQAYNSTLAAVAGGTYTGDDSITTVGTIGAGVWQGTAVGVAYGGTGATDASGARTNLGLVIGTDVQAYNSTLAAVAGGTYTGDDSITTVGTIGTGTWQGTAVGPVYGGTGLSSYTTGDLLYASATNTLSKLAAGTGKYMLRMNAGGTAPEWTNVVDGGTP